MPKRRRWDLPGTWHHAMNRGVGHRSIFETGEDVRYFRSRLAEAVRRGDVEIHAWCAMTTHFHLLVRSPDKRLGTALRRIQHEYTRWFNRRRERDGPLYRSRFTSKSIDSLGYRRTVVRYIDANAVNAKLVTDALRYTHGSAIAHGTGSGQPWLSRDWIEKETLRVTGAPAFHPALYARAFPPLVSPEAREWVERRLESNVAEDDPLDDLLAAAPSGFLDWLTRKTEEADGTHPGIPLAGPTSVTAAIESVRTAGDGPRLHAEEDWRALHAGLLRELAAASYTEIAARLALSTPGAHKARARHVRRLQSADEYGEIAASIARRILVDLHCS